MWIKRRTPLVEDPAGAKMFVRVYTVSPKRFELYAIRQYLIVFNQYILLVQSSPFEPSWPDQLS
jgi:hypothetical protein